jgi:DNA invertase Pin-like site-specific DNA recombinase
MAPLGVGYRSYTEQYLDSCGVFRDAVLSILATTAKQEGIRLSERVVAGLDKARREGRVGGRPRLVINRARVVRMAEDGLTMREIGEELGVSAASVSRILSVSTD